MEEHASASVGEITDYKNMPWHGRKHELVMRSRASMGRKILTVLKVCTSMGRTKFPVKRIQSRGLSSSHVQFTDIPKSPNLMNDDHGCDMP